jgi:hypothetical protein
LELWYNSMMLRVSGFYATDQLDRVLTRDSHCRVLVRCMFDDFVSATTHSSLGTVQPSSTT